MNTMKYNKGIKITNLEQLSRGTGANFLEVARGQNNDLVAVRWRKIKPKKLEKNRILISF